MIEILQNKEIACLKNFIYYLQKRSNTDLDCTQRFGSLKHLRVSDRYSTTHYLRWTLDQLSSPTERCVHYWGFVAKGYDKSG